MTEIQKLLRGGASLAELETRYAIQAVPSETHPSLVLLKYNQISSPMNEIVVRQARGIILDSADNWICVARGFDKFFNLGEPGAAEIDWRTARVQEKIDGSLCMVYWYGEQWNVATTGRPDASGNVNETEETFAELFWRIVGEQTFEGALVLDSKEHAYLFELTSPANRVVVQHKETRITLLAIRDIRSGEELHRSKVEEIARRNGIPVVREFELASFDQIQETMQAINPLEQEGYVVVDGAGQRLKIKHPKYVEIHRMRSGVTRKIMLEIVRQGEAPEICTYFPEVAEQCRIVSDDLAALVTTTRMAFEKHAHIVDQKQFAMAVKNLPFNGALFKLKAGRVSSAEEFYATCMISHVMKLLGYKDDEADGTSSRTVE